MDRCSCYAVDLFFLDSSVKCMLLISGSWEISLCVFAVGSSDPWLLHKNGSENTQLRRAETVQSKMVMMSVRLLTKWAAYTLNFQEHLNTLIPSIKLIKGDTKKMFITFRICRILQLPFLIDCQNVSLPNKVPMNKNKIGSIQEAWYCRI